jgi:polysaccharide biosynthesis protein PslH
MPIDEHRPRALIFAPIYPMQSLNGLAMRLAMFVDAIDSFAKLDILLVPVAGALAHAAGILPSAVRLRSIEPKLDPAYTVINRIDDLQQRAAALRLYGRPRLSALLAPDVIEAVRQAIGSERYDTVHVARAYMLPLLDCITDGPRISIDLDEDDAETLRDRSGALSRAGDPLCSLLLAEADNFTRVIARYAARADTIFASSVADRMSLVSQHPSLKVDVVPNGVEIPPRFPKRDDGRTITFVGAFGYEPNVEGAVWFTRFVLPRLQAGSSQRVLLRLAGASPPAIIQQLQRQPNVEVIGDFRSVADVYGTTSIAISPMRFGRGLRTKIVEAAAHEVVCVAHAACMSDEFSGNIGTVVARDADEFSNACGELLDDPAKRRRWGTAARQFVKTHFDRQKLVNQLATKLNTTASGG